MDELKLSEKRQKLDKSKHITRIKTMLQAIFLNMHTKSNSHNYCDWPSMLNYLRSKDEEIRWLSCHTIAKLLKMSYSQKKMFILQYCTKEGDIQLSIKYLENSKQLEKIVFQELANSCATNTFMVGAVPLPIVNAKGKIENASLVELPSTMKNLEAIAMSIKLNSPVLIEGIVGSGKTCLVEYLAEVTGRKHAPMLTKVQLGGQIDCKSLIGTYRCTKNPGEFLWQAGSITKCVMEGHWLLLEDINMAPMEVISHLIPLVELRSLPVPGYGTIKAHENFHIFATMRKLCTERDSALGPLASIENFFKRVCLQPLTTDELKSLISFRFSSIPGKVVDKLIEIYLIVASSYHPSSNLKEDCEQCQSVPLSVAKSSGRLVSVRDLMKLCKRIVQHTENDDLNMRLYHESFDCFCSAISDDDKRQKCACHIASHLGISPEMCKLHYNSYKPEISVRHNQFVVGDRSRIAINTKRTPLYHSKQEIVFSETRLSCCLLERITIATIQKEPVLLVGETGTGKTSTVQYLSRKTGNKLNVLNMNQQSDSSDLLGGFKPVELSTVIDPIKTTFENLFAQTYNTDENLDFLLALISQHKEKNWNALVALMKQPAECAIKMKGEKKCISQWVQFLTDLKQCEKQISKSAVAFSYIEGTLVKAVTEGEWVLLDEVNLASPETLECLSGLLESSDGSITLHEKGDYKPIKRHPNFQLFACMNPATDVGKKELPAGLRNRFTEFYMDEFSDVADLMQLVGDYLKNLNLRVDQIKKIVDFYFDVRQSAAYKLADGTNNKPHFSLRTLCRALSVAKRNPLMVIQRSLYEAFCLSFLTQLDRKSHDVMKLQIAKFLVGYEKNFKQTKINLKMDIPCPGKKQDYVEVCKYWIPRGRNSPKKKTKYILTKAVQQNLHDLVRIVSIGRFPILLQGDTSVGKTSLITYLAELTGNVCVRINNHQHTDIQEYIGCYGPDDTGKLIFKKGALVNAMERGDWVILDELNLAPTDVLEALNRLLDDNKELFIPEIGQSIKAHPKFMLFATQNPPRQYGGRQLLSRAFRNRFVELHFDLIPTDDLQQILHLRCDIPLSYCEKMVAVHEELQKRRRETNLFEGKQSFITLRDLFRWAERYRLAPKQTSTFYDWRQHLAEEGYLILGGRVRQDNEEEAVKQVLEAKILNDKIKNKSNGRAKTINVQNLFTLSNNTSPVTRNILEQLSTIEGFEHIVWTYDMRRLFVLVSKSLSFGEPVLLVGETGCGKTSVCQMIASLTQKQLRTVNCHMHSEGADFLGGIRPTRDRQSAQGKMFEWVDGPLVLSMKEGGLFLADEISLADDSVLERLNSVLEPERTLILTEKGTDSDFSQLLNSEIVVATEPFRFVGTMNPGGDFGKKELSTALRNRFTEIWCPKIDVTTATEDVVSIVEHNIVDGIVLANKNDDSGIGRAMLSFLQHFVRTEVGKKCTFSIRDLLSWILFINKVTKESNMPIDLAYVHGACLVVLDSLGSGATGSSVIDWRKGKEACLKFLCWQVYAATGRTLQLGTFCDENVSSIRNSFDTFGVGPFEITKKRINADKLSFAFKAPRTSANLMRLLRGLQLSRPILLEGSPGVGKTSLVIALAKQTGHDIIRINLSEQTDVSDLFGADFPVEDEEVPRFAWRDGPLLQALKSGCWVVFDELNLASQPVLEGLNACFDHRGEVYVPELNRTFKVEHQQTKIFACQNPQYEGGARKGLPKSFLNRFTQVFVESFSAKDLHFILTAMYENIPEQILKKMVEFNDALICDMNQSHWGRFGGPWEFNLRDMFRWCDIMEKNQCGQYNPGEYVCLIYADRLRKQDDKKRINDTYQSVFGSEYPLYEKSGKFFISDDKVQFGRAITDRTTECYQADDFASKNLYIMNNQTPTLESLVNCINMNWMVILVGASGEGKTTLVQMLAKLCGKSLKTFPVNSEMDVTELLGGFEQGDKARHLQDIKEKVEMILLHAVRVLILAKKMKEVGRLLLLWENFTKSQAEKHKRVQTEPVKMLSNQCALLISVISELEKLTSDAVLMEQLSDLKRMCVKVQAQVEKSGKITGGGTFEWVDSILVKAVRNGDWLLIDGVNLCSPSVLDRLNGLLEPGGVLTLNEKGAVNGIIPSLTPHDNFRLFLAMDPKHGELSRAMRNRGIELCLTKSWDATIDMQSLMSSGNLTDAMVQNVLYHFHKLITSKLPGYEKPKINALIQASQQIAKHMEMGVAWRDAVKSAIEDCYLNTSISSNGRKTIIELMASEFKQLLMEDSTINYYSLNIMLPVKEIIRNHDAVFANQLHALIRFMSSTAEDMLQKYLNCPLPLPIRVPIKSSSTDALYPAIITFLASFPCSQWTILRELYGQSDKNGYVTTLLNKLIEKFKSGTLDPRSVFTCTFNQYQFDTKTSDANKNLISLWTAANITRGFDKLQKLDATSSKKEMSIMELSRALFSKSVGNTFKIPSGVKYLHCTFNDFENFLVNLPFKNMLICSDDLYFNIISGMRWIRQLKVVCENVLSVSKVDAMSPIISFYWKMITDNFISVFATEWEMIVPASLKNNVNKMNAHFNRKAGLARDVVASMPKRKDCLSFYSQHHYQYYQRIYNILNRSAPKLESPLINAILAVHGKQMKKSLFDIAASILHHNSLCYEKLSNDNSSHADVENEIMHMAEGWSMELTKFEDLLDERLSSIANDQCNATIQMWPLFDHFACKSLEARADNCGNAISIASHIPANIMWMMSNVTSMPYSFLYLFKISSCATNNVAEWMMYSNESGSRQLCNKSALLFSDVCSLTYLFITGTFSSGKDLDKIKVGSHFDQKIELRQFQSLIYNNWNYLRIHGNSSVSCYSQTVNRSTAEFLSMLSNSSSDGLDKEILSLSLVQRASLILKNSFNQSSSVEEKKIVDVLFLRITNSVQVLAKSTDIVSSAKLGIASGLLQTWLLSHMDSLDPMVRRDIFLMYYNSELNEINHVCSAYQWLEAMRFSQENSDIHPHMSHLEGRLDPLRKEIESLKKEVSYREASSNYSQLFSRMSEFVSNIFSPLNVIQLIDRICNTDGKPCIREGINALHSWDNFVKDMITCYPVYRDILIPILDGVCLASEGLRILISKVQRENTRQELKLTCEVDEFISEMVAFPINRCTNSITELRRMRDLQNNVGNAAVNGIQYGGANVISMSIRSTMYDIYNSIVSEKRTSTSLFQIFDKLIQKVFKIWQHEEEKRQEKEMKEESLYVHKKTETEDEEIEREFIELFPDHRIEFDVDEDQEMMEEEGPDNLSESGPTFEEEHLHELILMHKIITSLSVTVARPYYVTETPKVDLYPCTSHILRLKQMQALFKHMGPFGSEYCDSESLSGIMLSNHMCLSVLEGGMDLEICKRPFNFYKDASPKEAIKIVVMLKELNVETSRLLATWEEHPALIRIKNIINRVLNLSVTSPLIKLVTGLEAVLTVSQEWQRIAHRGVTLKNLDKISEQIRDWRKMELTNWNMCLEMVTHDVSSMSAKWWWHLYATLINSITTYNPSDIPDLIKNLKTFMESSPVGQYKDRLQFLASFHLHLLIIEQTEGYCYDQRAVDQLISLTWNTYRYYLQFLTANEKTLDGSRKPIEKTIKEFVKISRWNDKNFFSIQESVNKSHRTLHREMRKWKKVLLQLTSLNDANLASDNVTNNDIVIDIDEPINMSNIIVRKTEGPTSKLISYIPKCSKFMAKMVKDSHYLELQEIFNGLTGEVITSFQESTDAMAEAAKISDKELKTKRVKEVIHRKRNLLANMFKTFKLLGISHTKGNNLWKEGDLDKCLLVSPIKSSMFHQSIFKIQFEKSCEKLDHYFFRNIARLSLLNGIIEKPHEDLGPELIKIIKGSSYFNLLLVRELRSKIPIKSLCQFRYLVDELEKSTNGLSSSSTFFMEKWLVLSAQLSSLFLTIKEAKVIISCYVSDEPLVKFHETSSFSSECMAECSTILQGLEETVDNLIGEVSSQYLQKYQRELALSHKENVAKLENYYERAQLVSQSVKKMCAIINPSLKSEYSLLRQMSSWVESFEKVYSDFIQWVTYNSIVDTTQESCGLFDSEIFRKLFCRVQNLYKLHCEREAEDAESIILISQLRRQGHDISSLGVPTLTKILTLLVCDLQEHASCNMLLEIKYYLPILKSYLIFCDNLILSYISNLTSLSKLQSVIVGMFIQLGLKGYCRPVDVEYDGEGEGIFNFEESGPGLAEGEGAKDVSDKLESEDQIESALEEGQKEKSADEECAEEETGVELNSDFEGKLQDLDQNEEEEGTKSDDEEQEELDKQMDKTDEGADKLDEKLWEGEEEPEDNERQTEEGDSKEKQESSDDVVTIDGELENNKNKSGDDYAEGSDDTKDLDKKNENMDKEKLEEEEVSEIPDLAEQDDEETSDMTEQEDQETQSPEDESGQTIKENEPTKEDIEETKPAEEDTDETVNNDDIDEEESEGETTKCVEGEDEPSDDLNNPPEAFKDDHYAGKDGNDDLCGNGGTGVGQRETKDLPENQDEMADDGQEKTDSADDITGSGQPNNVDNSGDGEAVTLSSQFDKQAESLKRNKTRKVDEKKSIGQSNTEVDRNLNTKKASEGNDCDNEEKRESLLYEHLTDPGQHWDKETTDAATEEQVNKMPPPEDETEHMDGITDSVEEENNMKNGEVTKKRKAEDALLQQAGKRLKSDQNDIDESSDHTDITSRSDANSGTRGEDIFTLISNDDEAANLFFNENTEKNLSEIEVLSSGDIESGIEEWNKVDQKVTPFALELCEKLRLVLEPTQASKLKGDFRTGKRLNMRKIIPYIASDFRKDKIWLRRTMPNKRTYQILIAIDDSESMVHVNASQLAKEGVAMVAKALNYLEAGNVGIISFGMQTKILHAMNEPFSDQAGAKVFSNLNFNQNESNFDRMLRDSASILKGARGGSGPRPNIEQLLIILSDGQTHAKSESVRQAVRAVRDQRVFVVFIVLDPEEKNEYSFHSVLVWDDVKCKAVSILDVFPFPFFLVVRNLSNLPSVLSTALRQWFELIS